MFEKTKKIMLVILCFIIVLAVVANAKESDDVSVSKISSDVKLGKVVVSATKSKIYTYETGASLTVITASEIEKKGKKYVSEILSDVPGVTLTKSGNITSVFLRGGKSGNTLVMIDGVKVNDLMSPGKLYDFTNLPVDNIERIEVIRGPQSTLYGSDATGGVINIITKKGVGDPVMTVTLEGGSNMTFREGLSVVGGSDKVNCAVGITREDSKGISHAKKEPGTDRNTDRDKYENTSISSKVGITLPYNFNLLFGLQFVSADYDLDDGSYADDPNHRGDIRQLIINSVLEHTPLEWWDHKLIFGYTNVNRRDDDNKDKYSLTENTNSWFEANYNSIDWQNNFYLAEINVVTMGVELETEEGSTITISSFGNSELSDKSTDTWSGYLQNHLKLYNRIFHTIGVRYDHHSEFGSNVSWQTSLSLIVPFSNTRLKGNYGTGFKAPSVYELYDESYGNKELDPEESKSWDVGFEQPFFEDRLVLAFVYFKNDYTNMIDFSTKYDNIGKVETDGIETELTLKLPFDIDLGTSYTWTRTEDKKTEERLLKRPEHQAAFNVNWEFIEGGNLNLGFIFVGERDDVWYDSSYARKDVKDDAYYKIDLSASYWVNSFCQAFGRIENVTNKDYEEVVGYNTPGISFYGGIKAKLQ